MKNLLHKFIKFMYKSRYILLALTLLLLGLLGWIVAVPFPEEALAPELLTSTTLTDRRGGPLREVLNGLEGRSRWLKLEEIDPDLRLATIHAEDQRFEEHPGVDPIAIGRSVVYNVRRGEVFTGASTITQQTVKLVLYRDQPRTLGRKLMEAVWALRLERARSKDAILESYLNRVPYGNQRFGAEAAARLYFGKPASSLSLAEAAFLAGLPQSPSAYNPYRSLEKAQRRQRWLLDLMLERGAITADQHQRAVAEPLLLRRADAPLAAPHFTEHVLRGLDPSQPLPATIPTTLDPALQRDVEGIVEAHLRRIEDRGAQQGAVVVLDVRTGDVRAWVGSRGYDDAAREGANDGVLALRQPGSTLKPFVYGLYLQRGGTAADMFADLPSHFTVEEGVYIPKNYDQRFHGPVSLRHALGSSLNVPAVAAAVEVGPAAVVDVLHRAGITTLQRDPADYGPGIALGNGEVRLLDLTAAYGALARGGRPLAPRLRLDQPAAPRDLPPIFSPEVVATLLDILGDDTARSVGYGQHGPLDMPLPVSAKTGTSTNFRDSWAVGVSPDYAVGVWVGSFDGRPMTRVAGGAGAAPILRHVFQALYPQAANPGDVRGFRIPSGMHRQTVCALSGLPAHPGCPHTRSELLPLDRRGASSAPGIGGHRAAGPDTCWMHALLAVHPDDGLRAPAGCPGATPRAFTRVPPAWAAWAQEEGLQPPPDAFSPRCPPPAPDDLRALDAEREALAAALPGLTPRLTHPLSGDRFALDFSQPPAHQRLALRAEAPEGVTLTFFVDGAPIGRAAAPWVVTWQLQPGAHTLGVGRGDAPEDEVQIEVK